MGACERFFLIEDDAIDAKRAYGELTMAGHKFTGYAENFQEAIILISHTKDDMPTVVVLDGNLGHNNKDCGDGKEIAQLIRRTAPEVKIIAYSRSDEKVANFGDIYVNKDPHRLAEVVTAIPPRK